MQILNNELFKNELEWLEALKEAKGWVNEKIISFCDRHHLADRKEPITLELVDLTINFLVKIFNDFGIDIDSEDRIKMERYFLKVEKPNYYTIKAYLIKKIDRRNFIKEYYD